MRDLMVPIAETIKAKYGDIRVEDKYTNQIEVINGEINRIVPSVERTASVRVLDGVWGLAPVNVITKEELLSSSERASKVARAGKHTVKEEVGINPRDPIVDSIGLGEIQDPRDFPLEEKCEIILECDKAARSIDSRIASTRFLYRDEVTKQYFANSEGSYIEQAYSRTRFRIVITAREGENIQTRFQRLSLSGGQELMAFADPIGLTESIAKDALNLLGAPAPPTGKKTVVIDNQLSGLVTACIAAFCEIRHAQVEGSATAIFKDKMGDRIASNLFTILDDPTYEGLPVNYKYDSEGVPAEPTPLVEDGILKSYLHSRATAYKTGTPPTGHSRAPNAAIMPEGRMSNAILKSGDMSLDELFEGVSDGVYLVGMTGANVEAIFQGVSQTAFEIKNGEIGHPLRRASFTIDFTKDLKKTSGIGNDFAILPLQMTTDDLIQYEVCGGGPHIQFEELTVGGA